MGEGETNAPQGQGARASSVFSVSGQGGAAAGKLDADLMGAPRVKGNQYQSCVVLCIQHTIGEGCLFNTPAHSVDHKGLVAKLVVQQEVAVDALGFCWDSGSYTEIFLFQIISLDGGGKGGCGTGGLGVYHYTAGLAVQAVDGEDLTLALFTEKSRKAGLWAVLRKQSGGLETHQYLAVFE